MSTGIAALITLAALTVTYVCCVRPMLRGHRQEAELDRQIAELRDEVRVLRAENALDGGRQAG